MTEMIKNYEVFTPVVEYNDKQAVRRSALRMCTLFHTYPLISPYAGLDRNFNRFEHIQLHSSLDYEQVTSEAMHALAQKTSSKNATANRI